MHGALSVTGLRRETLRHMYSGKLFLGTLSFSPPIAFAPSATHTVHRAHSESLSHSLSLF